MKKKLLSGILAALMLSSSVLMSACSNNSPENTPEDTQPAANQQEVTPIETDEAEVEIDELSDLEQRQLIPDNVPEYNFNGTDFVVCTVENTYDNGFRYEDEICADNLNGDACNDAVFNRNVKVEDRLNIKIKVDTNMNAQSLPKTMASSGSQDYQLVALYNYQSYIPITAQAILNWRAVENVDFDQPWHNKLANDDATVNGILYTACSDLSITSMTFAHAIFANLDMAANYGFSPSDLYGTVQEGKWTFDYMTNIVKDMYLDLNGNSQSDINDDQFGFGYRPVNPADVWFTAFGGKMTGRDADGNLTITFMEEKTVDEIAALLDFHYNNPGFAMLSTQYDEEQWFLNQKLVFAPMRFNAAFGTLRDMDAQYTMLPFPKWDETQDAYYTNADDKFSVFCIPKSLYDQTEMIGAVYEVLSAESYKSVYPVYTDIALKGKYSTDAETAAIVDIILAGRMFDFGFQFGMTVFQDIPYMFRTCIQDNDPNIASKYESIQNKLEKQIEKTIVKVYELGE